MIRKIFNNEPHVVWQRSDEELPNSALALSVDDGGTVCIFQEDDCIVLNRETIPELCKLLKKLAEAS